MLRWDALEARPAVHALHAADIPWPPSIPPGFGLLAAMAAVETGVSTPPQFLGPGPPLVMSLLGRPCLSWASPRPGVMSVRWPQHAPAAVLHAHAWLLGTCMSGLSAAGPQARGGNCALGPGLKAHDPDPAALRRAFRRAALRWHPDRFARRMIPGLPERERADMSARVAGLAQQVSWEPELAWKHSVGLLSGRCDRHKVGTRSA